MVFFVFSKREKKTLYLQQGTILASLSEKFGQ